MFSKILEVLRAKKNVILEYGVYLFVIVFILYLAPNFLLEKIVVDGTSMQDSLQDEEQVLIEKISRYFDGPDRFDIIVFTKKNASTEKVYIKRVIGMPGDKVQIVDNVIYINDQVLPEEYGKNAMLTEGIAAEPIVLGDDEYFVLGDHRSVSIDSRDARVGVVKKSEIDGVVVLRIYPFKKFGKVD